MSTDLKERHNDEILSVLKSSLYPGAQDESVAMVLEYCKAAKLDPMQKPVHIVPMWIKDAKSGQGSMRDVVMPGIGLYRIQAARSGQYAGMSEPEFGDEVTTDLTDDKGKAVQFQHPQWCRVTVYRRLDDGQIVGFTAREYWLENYATAGRNTGLPNAMWQKRKYGQLAKCAEAQALRKAFPEFGSAPTAEEMEGKEYIDTDVIGSVGRQSKGQIAAQSAEESIYTEAREQIIADLQEICKQGMEALQKTWTDLDPESRRSVGTQGLNELKQLARQHDKESQDAR